MLKLLIKSVLPGMVSFFLMIHASIHAQSVDEVETRLMKQADENIEK